MSKKKPRKYYMTDKTVHIIADIATRLDRLEDLIIKIINGLISAKVLKLKYDGKEYTLKKER